MGGGRRRGVKKRLKADAQFNKRLEASQNLCCCCGLFVATEPNGLCKDCAENCAGYLLKDKPCETIELESHFGRDETMKWWHWIILIFLMIWVISFCGLFGLIILLYLHRHIQRWMS